MFAVIVAVNNWTISKYTKNSPLCSAACLEYFLPLPLADFYFFFKDYRL